MEGVGGNLKDEGEIKTKGSTYIVRESLQTNF